jgi:hypothetical protein
MTVLSFRQFVARPRWRAIVIRNSVIRTPSATRRERRAYRDSFFADPAVVEDDARRMTHGGTPAR